MTILVTGGAGYIGSHTVVELQQAGHTCIIVDNLSNSRKEVIDAIADITGTTPIFYQADIGDDKAVAKILDDHSDIEAVIHFAAAKAVGESVEQPLRYYTNNVADTVRLLTALKERGITKSIFSSSATVYGAADTTPTPESADAQRATNPYGQSKVMLEQILKDCTVAYPDWRVRSLRYFNPIGAHPSGKLGEWAKSTSPGLVPSILRVVHGDEATLQIHGDDFDTKDGTCIRDYIHIADLAKGHLAAIDSLTSGKAYDSYNLGSGTGFTVKEIITAMKQATKSDFEVVVGPRRAGDIATSCADTKKAHDELGWSTTFNLQDMCDHTWQWEQHKSNL